jgi:hypothetical protein
MNISPNPTFEGTLRGIADARLFRSFPRNSNHLKKL